MSKKTKLKLDNQNVLLEIEDLTDCCFELWELDNKKSSLVKVKMSVKTWKELVKKWEDIRRS
tara:strand:+ start:193 stop:378 length:186 start_codon:yes stop_codon:yes gene_type:complete